MAKNLALARIQLYVLKMILGNWPPRTGDYFRSRQTLSSNLDLSAQKSAALLRKPSFNFRFTNFSSTHILNDVDCDNDNVDYK